MEDDCWLYAGPLNSKGYGVVCMQSVNYLAHRVFYELYKGKIPEGLVIDHLCRVTACVNPEHLEAVTSRENILRGIALPALNARKTHCQNGHQFNEENTIVFKNGTRNCRQCRNAYKRAHYVGVHKH